MSNLRLTPWLFCLFAPVILSCSSDKAYAPAGLRKLTGDELIERVTLGMNIKPEEITCKNELGQELTWDSARQLSLDMERWTPDLYVDQDGKIREMVIREAAPLDSVILERLKQVRVAQHKNELVDIDCAMKAQVLQDIFESDQSMHTSGNIDPEIDRQNLTKVVSLIEQCGMPTLQQVTPTQMAAVFAVLQHGDNATRKKYLPLMEKAAAHGDVEASEIALMKDRILMADGKAQVYGSQVIRKDGRWTLYNLQDPQTVDTRRAEVGLGPLKDYLERWGIVFDVEQTR